jgi:hypothetical protein
MDVQLSSKKAPSFLNSKTRVAVAKEKLVKAPPKREMARRMRRQKTVKQSEVEKTRAEI